MARTLHRSTLVLLLIAAACSDDDAGSASDGQSTVITTADDPTVAAAASSSTALPTTGGTTGDDTATTGDDTTSTSTSTTGDDTTTTGDDATTGSICDPGQPACVCDDDQCIDGYTCQDGVCAAAFVCGGDDEAPGESETTPTPLADVTDNDDDFHQVSGILSGSDDVDWYRVHGSDKVGYFAEPSLEVLSMSAGMRVCMFFECDNGGVAGTDLGCPAGTKFAISGDLRPGCCHTTGFEVSDLDCNTNDESADIYIRLDQPAEDACVDYEFKFHF